MTLPHLSATQLFPTAVAIMELGAFVIYLLNKEWRLAILWGGYTIAAFALATIRH